MSTSQYAILVVGCMLPVAGVVGFQGLIAIWAATGRAHWFLRALVAYGGVMAFVPIRAYEPAATFAICSLLVIAGLKVPGIWKRRRLAVPAASDNTREPGKLRFGLRDLFLLVLLAALLLVGWKSINQAYNLRDWIAFLAAGTMLAAMVLLSYRVSVGPRRWLWAAALLSVAPLTPIAAWASGPNTKAESVWQVAWADHVQFNSYDILESAKPQIM